MIVYPYRYRKGGKGSHVTVCLLGLDGRVVSEHGEQVDLQRLPPGYHVWTDLDTARHLVSVQGIGESLCWNGTEIRWRPASTDDDWTPRRTDVSVIRCVFPDRAERTLAGLAGWRDWLEDTGARCTGTSGAAAMSLLRATLTGPLRCSWGAKSLPVRWTTGGRQEIGPRGQQDYVGRLEQLDLPAAYAATLAGLRYGGIWQRVGPDRVAGWPDAVPVFVRATVRVPAGVRYGPVPRRLRARPSPLREQVLRATGRLYPRGPCRLRGVWTREELLAAERAGCRVTRVEGWAHRAGSRLPFAPWWAAIGEGRDRGGLAGLLAKLTGNALWGRFCMETPADGEARSIRRHRQAPLILVDDRPTRPAHDLAETVSGRVRARLYDAIVAAGDSLVCAHTDGLWVQNTGLVLPGWRAKKHARRLQLVDAQTMRLWNEPAKPWDPEVVVAGVPTRLAPKVFEMAWNTLGVNLGVNTEVV